MTTTSVIPPIVKTVVVPGEPARAFRLFTDEVGEWWPMATHSVGGAASQGVRLTPAGFVEVLADGTESAWGEIVEWAPPYRLAFTWHPGYDPAEQGTEVVVTFAPHGDGTEVRLEHTGWERLGARAAETRADYDIGWVGVLDLFARLAESPVG